MNIKLHNKFEIILGESSYTFFNTMTHKVFENIMDGLKPYATYFAFGNGTGQVDYLSSKLSNYVASYPSELEELQCDPSKGELYVKRVVSLDEDTAEGLSFCEIGITASAENNPDVCNHIQIVDSDGDVCNIVKEQGQSLLIRVTIYLSLQEDSNAYLIAGENRLIKAILGEGSITAPAFTAMRGYNLQPNVCLKRNVPREGEEYTCSFTASANADGNPQLQIDFDLDTGITPEVVVLMDKTPIARINLLEYKECIQQENIVSSQSNNTIDCGEYIKEVVSLADLEQNLQTDYIYKSYASDFTDYIASPFDADIDATTPRWVSRDGDKLAFVSGSTLYIYANDNYMLSRLTVSVPTQDLADIIMFKNYLFAVYSASPYLRVYTLSDSTYSLASTNFDAYNSYGAEYSWQDFRIIETTKSGEFIIGILNTTERVPLICNAKFENNIFSITSVASTVCPTAVYMYDIYKNSFCDSIIVFITDNYASSTSTYRLVSYYADGTTDVGYSLVANYLLTDTVSLESKSRAVIAKKSVSPYIWLFYYPTVYRYSISLTEGVKNWISTDLMYLIQYYENEDEAPYKIYSLTNYNNPQEFTNGFPSDLDISTIVDFEFLKDTLLIFTNSGVKALNLKLTNALIENVALADTDYTVTTKKYNLLGTNYTEGVSGKLTVEFEL